MIKDAFERVHDYLRISLTDNCNFRCFYCMPDEHYDFTPPSGLMQAEEIFQLASIFVANGVKKIRLTGGEPLVRKDAGDIISMLGQLPVELVITTNGTRIEELLPVLIQAGIKTINVSLDTLNEEKFLFITRRNVFHKVKNNIELLLASNIRVKINMVVMKGLNEGEINDFVNWTKDHAIEVKFIEFMPFSGNRWTSNKLFSLEEILQTIERKYTIVHITPKANDTAKLYQIPGHRGTFSIISTMTVPFCSTCNRMRLTADGKFKNCLFSAGETDLLTPFRAGEDILPLIKNTIWNKKKEMGGQLTTDTEKLDVGTIQNRSMISIGG